MLHTKYCNILSVSLNFIRLESDLLLVLPPYYLLMMETASALESWHLPTHLHALKSQHVVIVRTLR